MSEVAGKCPACGLDTLFLSAPIGGPGHITCAFADCPRPGAVDDFLHDHMTQGEVKVYGDVRAERKRQDEKWGDQSDNDDHDWSDVLGEEFGEVCKARLHNKFGGEEAGNLRVELIQTAAVSIAWAEAIDKRGQDNWDGRATP